MADTSYADLLDSLSPLSAAGIDPDEARLDRAATMAKLGLGQPQQQPWLQAQNDAPPQPGVSPNGNALPPGLKSRTASPAVPAGVTPSGTDMATVNVPQPPDLAAGNAATIGQMQTDYSRASNDVQNEAAQPDLATLEDPIERQRVSAQRRQVELQNPYDPQTGKLLPEYKPSFGTRFMRGVEGFAKGGVLGVVDPKVGGATPYGAPNKQLGIDQQQAAGQVAGADQQLSQLAAAYKEKSDRLKQVASDRRALATTGKDVTGASIAQQEVPIKQQQADADTQRVDNESPESKAKAAQLVSDQQVTQRQKQADSLGLKGQNRTLYLANGKIPDPRQATAEEIARAQATAAWHRDNPGKNPGLDDIRSINAAVSGSEIKNTGKGGGKPISPALQNKILDEKNAGMSAATAQLRAGMSKSGTPYTKEDWQADMQAAQDKFESAIEAEGGTVDHMAVNPDGSWTAASGAKPKPASSAATPASYTPPPVPKEQLRENRTGIDQRTGQRVIVKGGKLVPLQGGA